MPLFSNKLSPERSPKLLSFFLLSLQPFRGRCDLKKHGDSFDGAAEIFRKYSTFKLRCNCRTEKFNHVVNVTRRVCDIMFNVLHPMESLLDAIARVDFESKAQDLKSETEGILSTLCCSILTLQ